MTQIEPNIPSDQVTNQYISTHIVGRYDSLSEEEKRNSTHVII